MGLHDLEFRMYGLVPYNISDIQKGIQFQHAVTEYMIEYPMNSDILDELGKWAHYDKTSIILNGGTTNVNPLEPGTLNIYLDKLEHHNIPVSKFKEPDLGNQLTAVVFLADERVWDKDKYPDFEWGDYKKWIKKFNFQSEEEKKQILFLRDFLPQFKLA